VTNSRTLIEQTSNICRKRFSYWGRQYVSIYVHIIFRFLMLLFLYNPRLPTWYRQHNHHNHNCTLQGDNIHRNHNCTLEGGLLHPETNRMMH
uniref:Uncharacterized protein n=1 Tax=Aegilops tauschii subsp. strangulata TaxID=200361 RepID=A0A453DFM7_AEGTS